MLQLTLKTPFKHAQFQQHQTPKWWSGRTKKAHLEHETEQKSSWSKRVPSNQHKLGNIMRKNNATKSKYNTAFQKQKYKLRMHMEHAQKHTTFWNLPCKVQCLCACSFAFLCDISWVVFSCFCVFCLLCVSLPTRPFVSMCLLSSFLAALDLQNCALFMISVLCCVIIRNYSLHHNDRSDRNLSLKPTARASSVPPAMVFPQMF